MPIISCELTTNRFEVSKEENDIYSYFDLPIPTYCPEERLRKRLMFRGKHQFFWANCHATGQRLLSIYPSSCNFPVIGIEHWGSKSLDAIQFGIEYDCRLGFFDQLLRLWMKVPRPVCSLSQVIDVRAVHNAFDVKRSFLVFDAHHIENCCYCVGVWESKNCVDCLNIYGCAFCYECVDCHQCFRLRWSEHCVDCRDSYFLNNCYGCNCCIFCSNLRDKQYCVFNEQVSPEQYEQLVQAWFFTSRSKVEEGKERFKEFLDEHVRATTSVAPEVIGDNYLYNCTRMSGSFECCDCSDVFYSAGLVRATRCIDCLGFGDNLNRAAQCIDVGNNATNVVNCISCFGSVSNLRYCSHCEDSANLLGCIGLRGKEFCILNKQYSEADYRFHYDLLVQNMKRENKWGSFFPANFSPFPYNLSLANEFMPLSRVQAKVFGFVWDESAEHDMQAIELLQESDVAPHERFAEVPELLESLDAVGFKKRVFICEMTGKPFQFTADELDIYSHLGVALPARCFKQRHNERRVKLSYLKKT